MTASTSFIARTSTVRASQDRASVLFRSEGWYNPRTGGHDVEIWWHEPGFPEDERPYIECPVAEVARHLRIGSGRLSAAQLRRVAAELTAGMK